VAVAMVGVVVMIPAVAISSACRLVLGRGVGCVACQIY
jgi:hypothetical protein